MPNTASYGQTDMYELIFDGESAILSGFGSNGGEKKAKMPF